MTIRPFSKLQDAAIHTIFQDYFCSTTAYAILGSTHGYSLSELKTEIKNTAPHKEDYALINQTDLPIGAIQVDQRDTKTNSLRLMIVMTTETQHHKQIHTLLTQKISQLRQELPALKIYSYLLPHEDHLKSLLTDLAFQREAVLDEHVFHHGSYYDLEIWGSQRKKVS